MGSITVGQENSTPVDLYYEDHGSGRPVLLVHGWPLSAASWEKQVSALLSAGHRVVMYDRRGFGHSSQPTLGYDYDTLAADLNTLLEELDLDDVALVGFSMGGGEVARYIGRYGSDRVSQAVFISAVPPYLMKAPDNPEGVDSAVLEGVVAGLRADRLATLAKFCSDFYNADVLGGRLVSDQVVQFSWLVAANASPTGTLDCFVSAFRDDFRADLRRFDIPTLVIHGDADRIVPYAAAGKRMPELVRDSRLVTLPGAPHGCIWTHADDVNREMLAFVRQPARARAAA